MWKIVWRFLKKLEIELPCYLAITLLGIYSQKLTEGLEETPAPMLTAT